MPSIWIKGGNQRGRRKEKKKKIKRGEQTGIWAKGEMEEEG